jgi:hypothetical protein
MMEEREGKDGVGMWKRMDGPGEELVQFLP